MAKRARRGFFSWVPQPNLVAEGQRALDEVRKEIEDGHRAAAAAAHGGAADGAGAGAGAGDAGYSLPPAYTEHAGAVLAGHGAGVANYMGQVAAMQALAPQQAGWNGIMVLPGKFWGVSGLPPLSAIPGVGMLPTLSQSPAPKVEEAEITVGELVGWRWWMVRDLGLDSAVVPVRWCPGRVMKATRALGTMAWDGQKEGGIYAFKVRLEALLANDVPGLVMAFGSVSLWGTVIEHELGYRAQYAKVRTLDWVGADRRATPDVLAVLRRVYGVGGAE